MVEIKKSVIIWSSIISLAVIILGIVCFLWGRIFFSFANTIESEVFGQFGDFVGGIVGTILVFLSILLLYYTFLLTKSQIVLQRQQHEELRIETKHQIELQQIQYEKQQIETRFFELLKIHRDNALQIQKNDDNIFKLFVEEVNNNYSAVKSWKNEKESIISIKDVIGVSYLTFFYGVTSKEGRNTIKDVLQQVSQNIDSQFVNDFIYEQIVWGNNPSKGHEIELGHYFRHLYQIVKYINTRDTNILSYKERYEYIKTLRAQLTTYEQILLFWNSLSPLGESWEIKRRNDSHIDKNKCLITKYNLIKNIPAKFANGDIQPNNFFPEVKFDWLKTPTNRNISDYY